MVVIGDFAPSETGVGNLLAAENDPKACQSILAWLVETAYALMGWFLVK